MARSLRWLAVVVFTGCEGLISVGPASPQGPGPGDTPGTPITPGTPGPGPGGSGGGEPSSPFVEVPLAAPVRRLTRAELAQSLRDLIDPALPVPIEQLPMDFSVPFDNDSAQQTPTPALIEGLEALTTSVAAWAMARPAVVAKVLGCQPTGPADAACFRTFVTTFGRRAFRRALTADEVTAIQALQASSTADNQFNSGVELALRALLQHPAFLYRFEPGTHALAAGVRALSGEEVAVRLSYLLTGSLPDAALLAQGESGALLDPAARVAAARRLFALPQARRHFGRFHAMWLGYDKQVDPLAAAMRAESDALVERTLFEGNRDFAELFTSQTTWLDSALAAHYQVAAPGQPQGGWVDLGMGPRRGILGHGSVLGWGTKAGDSSPTRRGIFVRTRLLCQTIAPPPPTVNVDQPPSSSDPNACKVERYKAHASGSCAACHSQMDPVGFGLETFDARGRQRTTEANRPECVIDGQGDLLGVGAFRGPAELGERIVGSTFFAGCIAKKVLEYSLGRTLAPADQPTGRDLGEHFSQSGRRFSALLEDLVSRDSFISREVAP